MSNHDQSPTGAAAERELLPCPHCGDLCDDKSVEHRWAGMWMVRVLCTTCQASGPVCGEDGSDEAERRAVAAWNRRADPAGFRRVPATGAVTEDVCLNVLKRHSGWLPSFECAQRLAHSLAAALAAKDTPCK